MGKAKNRYMELNSELKLELQTAESRDISILHSAFINLKGYKRISDHLIELEINGARKTLGIFRLVPEGNNVELYRKRVQIKKTDLDILPDFIIVAYINAGRTIYIRTTSIESVANLPNSVTTLFRIDIRFLANLIYKPAIKSEIIKSRKKDTELYISESFEKIFDENIEELNSDDFVFENSYDELEVENIDDLVKQTEEARDAYEIGLIAEKIVNKELKTKTGRIYETISDYVAVKNVKWINENGEQYKPLDFIIDGVVVEVKGSKEKGSFFYSVLENAEREKNLDNYILIKVDRIDKTNLNYKDVRIYTGNDLEKLEMKPVKYIVKENNE